MGRIYSVVYQGTIANASGDVDLLEILPATNKPVKLRGILLSQLSEVGDAAEEGLRISIIRLPATVTGGTGGSAPSPIPMDSANAAAGCQTEVNNSAVATTSGTAVTLAELAWNIRNSPYEMWFPDDAFCPKVKNGEALVVRQQTTAADDYTGCFTFWIEEE
jgi:hypothetical protein